MFFRGEFSHLGVTRFIVNVFMMILLIIFTVTVFAHTCTHFLYHTLRYVTRTFTSFHRGLRCHTIFWMLRTASFPLLLLLIIAGLLWKF